MRRAVRALLFGVTLALAACGGSDEHELGAPERYPVPGCEAFDPAPCNVLMSECQARLFGLAACLRGSDAGDVPPVVVMSQGDYKAYLDAQNSMRDPPPHRAEWESGLALLGLVQPGALEEMATESSEVSFVAGFYASETKVVNLVDRGSDSTPEATSAVLLHEFVHALQDRESDLTTFSHAHAANYDAELAADAVVEGEAQLQQERYLASMLGFDPNDVDFPLLFQNAVDVAEPKLLAEPSPFTAAHHYFPYDWGARYVYLGWGETGHAGVLDLFASPPADTLVEMASVDERAGDMAASEPVAPTPDASWTEIGGDSLGALGLFELLGHQGDVEQARAIALEWRDDHLALYGGTGADGAAATAIVWICDLDTTASALAAVPLITEIPGLIVRSFGPRVIIAAATDASALDWAFEGAAPK